MLYHHHHHHHIFHEVEPLIDPICGEVNSVKNTTIKYG